MKPTKNMQKSLFHIYVDMAVLLFLTLVVITPQGFAKATQGMTSFGGYVMFIVPAKPTPPCPAHTVIYDFVSRTLVGISTLPPFSNTFESGNLTTPGISLLGEHIYVPIVSCALPYQVYEAYYNFEFGKNQIGTASIPGGF